MTIRETLIVASSALLFAGGCARPARVHSAHLEESGTHVVATPGALTVAQKSASASHVCTMRTAGSANMKAKKGQRKMGGPLPGTGPGAMLDTLLFRLCEARANNDISAEQYAASVQMILKTMSEMAQRPPMPMGGPGMGMGMGMGMGRPGMGPGMGRPGMGRPGNRRGGPDGWSGPRNGPGRGGPPDADEDDDKKREKKKDK